MPQLHLFTFVPYLVMALYHHSLIGALVRATAVGALLDLFSSSALIGISSLQFCVTTLLLYGQKRNFFEEKLSTLPIMTFLFSFCATLVQILLLFFLGALFPLSWRWAASDLIGMSCIDALYALLVFSLPFQLISKVKKSRNARRA